MNLFGYLVGLPGRWISPTQGLYLHSTTQHRKKQTYIHVQSGIRNRDPSVRAAEDSTCLRPLGHCEWHFSHIILRLNPINFQILHPTTLSTCIRGRIRKFPDWVDNEINKNIIN